MRIRLLDFDQPARAACTLFMLRAKTNNIDHATLVPGEHKSLRLLTETNVGLPA
jgi:hypothetical protein